MLIPSLRLSREDGMGKPYSMDLRERVVAAIEGGDGPFSWSIRTAHAKARNISSVRRTLHACGFGSF